MTCYVCESEAPLRAAKISRYHYKECGLDNVILIQVPALRCKACQTVTADIPKPLELHALLTERIFSKPYRLSAKEVRFMRTQLGYSQAGFAKRIDRDVSALNRVENEKSPVSDDLDRQVRMVYLKEKEKPMRAYEELDALISAKEVRNPPYQVRLRAGHWGEVQRAA